MARYQLILAYDGTDFSGFQRQGKTRTVQQVVEKALSELGWQEETILFAGRTDSGVHADGQVISFSLDWQHDNADLVNALNAQLPVDAAVRDITQVKADFHPRYDATSRRYVYCIYQLPNRNPLLDRYSWRVWPPLDAELLADAARTFIGRNDFSAFGRPMKPGSTTIREIVESQWVKTPGGWEYHVTANAFLYHMVRRLVFVQVEAARGNISLEDLAGGLQTGSKLKPGLAPANGLRLDEVSFGKKSQGLDDEEN
jgi:tRNA pseudouridine38-40 synthase